MYKLILYMMMAAFYMTMYALQMDEEIAMHTLFQGKHALNRAVHAAAQEIDADKLSEGVYSIQSDEARRTAMAYLQGNLSLDPENMPLSGTFLKSKVEVLTFEIINEDQSFPYIYMNSTYAYTVTLERPGVIMIIRINYPRTYPTIGPITWEIKGAAELVY